MGKGSKKIFEKLPPIFRLGEGLEPGDSGYADFRPRVPRLKAVESVQQRKIIQVVPEEERLGSDTMDIGELCAVLGVRAEEQAGGAPLFTKTTHPDSVQMALQEVRQKQCPLTIIRHFGDKVELWPVNELNLPPHIA